MLLKAIFTYFKSILKLILIRSFSSGGSTTLSNGSPYSTDLVRKPTRLEALPLNDRKNGTSRKRSGPILNTMGTF